MFYLLHLKSYPIEEQLRLEQELLRKDNRNWCLINEGTAATIVMGISGKKEELVDTVRANEEGIPLIKRFSGGGTVIVDEGTWFVTFICQRAFHPFPAYPEPMMRWSEEIYRDVFQTPEFRLKENDFVFGDRKFGGNAQYITKERWLHHTSFLWDYSPQRMQTLLLPKKTPSYRSGRPHDEFLCRLKDYFPSKEILITRLKDVLSQRYGLSCTIIADILSAEPARYALPIKLSAISSGDF